MGYETAKAQRRAEPGVAYPLVVVGRLVVLGEVQAYVLGLFVDAQTDQLEQHPTDCEAVDEGEQHAL